MLQSIPTDTRGTKMETDLATIFAEQQTNKIDWGGPLYSLYELPTGSGEMTIRFVAFRACPPQGLRLKIRGGSLDIDGRTADEVVLWTDTAPTEVRVAINWKPHGARSLRIWNVWRMEEVTQAWLGNAGMRVSTTDNGTLLLRCSDGEGEPDFEDLIANVAVDEASAATPPHGLITTVPRRRESPGPLTWVLLVPPDSFPASICCPLGTRLKMGPW